VPSRDGEEVTWAHVDDTPVIHGDPIPARDDQADVFHTAARLPERLADVQGPSPAGLIARPADRGPAQAHQVEATEGHGALLIGLIETADVEIHPGLHEWD